MFKPKDVDGVMKYARGTAEQMRSHRAQYIGMLWEACRLGYDWFAGPDGWPWDRGSLRKEIDRLSDHINFFDGVAAVLLAEFAPERRTAILNAVWFRP